MTFTWNDHQVVQNMQEEQATPTAEAVTVTKDVEDENPNVAVPKDVEEENPNVAVPKDVEEKNPKLAEQQDEQIAPAVAKDAEQAEQDGRITSSAAAASEPMVSVSCFIFFLMYISAFCSILISCYILVLIQCFWFWYVFDLWIFLNVYFAVIESSSFISIRIDSLYRRGATTRGWAG